MKLGSNVYPSLRSGVKISYKLNQCHWPLAHGGSLALWSWHGEAAMNQALLIITTGIFCCIDH